MISLNGKTTVITGAGSGIGAAVAHLFSDLNRFIFLVKPNIKQLIQKITYTYPLKNYTFAILKLLQ